MERNRSGIDLELSGLSAPEVDFSDVKEYLGQMDELFEECVGKYGADEGSSIFVKELFGDRLADYDCDSKTVNCAIYDGCMPLVTASGNRVKHLAKLYEQRMRELYGDDYDDLVDHARGDKRVVQLLLDDAVRTGKWKELPDELQGMYENLQK